MILRSVRSCLKYHLKESRDGQGSESTLLKKIGQRGRISIWIVDGSYVRTNIDEEFTNFGQHYRFTYILNGGEEVNGLSLIYTPSHTDGSISLYSQNLRTIFVGDALRTDNNGIPNIPSHVMTLHMNRAIESLKTISSFDYEILLPGHGAPIFEVASRKIKDFAKELD